MGDVYLVSLDTVRKSLRRLKKLGCTCNLDSSEGVAVAKDGRVVVYRAVRRVGTWVVSTKNSRRIKWRGL